MLRFSSSPTGDMHVSDLRVALLNHIVAKQRKEDLIIRIDDLDKERNIEDKDKEILEIVQLFGIEYSQIIYQSENVRFHTAMALQLMHEKKAFSCFCSAEWIEGKRKEAAADNKAYRYDDACANLPAELVIDNTNPFTIRVNRPTQEISFQDHINGKVTFKPDDIDSFIIMQQDKTPTNNFACAVDDMLNDISIVIRGEDHMNDTPKQEHIRASLKYEKKIEYAHLPSILNSSSSVKSLLEEGYLPDAILNYLISIGTEAPKEIFTLAESLEWLDLKKISKVPVSFDISILRHINNEHLKGLDDKELSRYVGFADEDIGKLAKVYLKELSTTKELRSKIAPIFAKKEFPAKLKGDVEIMIETIKKAPYFDKYDDFKDYILKESALQEKNFLKTFRLVLTGADNGPDIKEIYKYLKNYIGEIVK